VARGDEPYCKLELDFVLHDPRWSNLSVEAKVVYLTVWATAVSVRRETLPSSYNAAYLARITGISLSNVRRSLSELCRVVNRSNGERSSNSRGSKLLHRSRGGRITVCGVRGKHQGLKLWKDENGSPNREETGKERGGNGGETGRRGEEGKGGERESARGRAHEAPPEEDDPRSNELLEYCLEVTAQCVPPSAKAVARSGGLMRKHKRQWCMDRAKRVVQKAKNPITDPNYILAALEHIAAEEQQGKEKRTEGSELLDGLLGGESDDD